MDIPRILPVPENGSSAGEVSTPVSPPAETAGGGGLTFTNDEFQQRVKIVSAAIEDPAKFRQCIAEIHTYLSLFDEHVRGMQQEMANAGGPMQMFRMMMRGGK